MADANYVRFNRRLADIDRQHKRLGGGYVHLEERNGLLVPVRRKRVRRGVPVRGLILSLGLFMAFKGFLYAHLGPVAYGERVVALNSGNIVEQFGAWAMHLDPLTLWFSTLIKPLM